MANLCAKFEVSSFNRSRDMEGVPKFTEWLTDGLTDSLTDWLTEGPLHTLAVRCWRVAGNPNPRLKLA